MISTQNGGRSLHGLAHCSEDLHGTATILFGRCSSCVRFYRVCVLEVKSSRLHIDPRKTVYLILTSCRMRTMESTIHHRETRAPTSPEESVLVEVLGHLFFDYRAPHCLEVPRKSFCSALVNARPSNGLEVPISSQGAARTRLPWHPSCRV